MKFRSFVFRSRDAVMEDKILFRERNTRSDDSRD